MNPFVEKLANSSLPNPQPLEGQKPRISFFEMARQREREEIEKVRSEQPTLNPYDYWKQKLSL